MRSDVFKRHLLDRAQSCSPVTFVFLVNDVAPELDALIRVCHPCKDDVSDAAAIRQTFNNQVNDIF